MDENTDPTVIQSLVVHGPQALANSIASEIAEATAEIPGHQSKHDEANQRHQSAVRELQDFRVARACLQRAVENSGEGVSELIEIEEGRLNAVMMVAGMSVDSARGRLVAARRRLSTAQQAQRQFGLMKWPAKVTGRD
jgi:hypothetical protein